MPVPHETRGPTVTDGKQLLKWGCLGCLGLLGLAIFLIAGDGPLKGRIEAGIAAAGLNGSIRMIGERADLDAVMLASETDLKNRSITYHTKSAPTAGSVRRGHIASIVPNPVATPLPPAKPMKIEAM